MPGNGTRLSVSCRYDTAIISKEAPPCRLSSSSFMVRMLPPALFGLSCGVTDNLPVTVSSRGCAGSFSRSARQLRICRSTHTVKSMIHYDYQHTDACVLKALQLLPFPGKHQGLCGEHTAIMVEIMWQKDMRAVASFIKGCLGVYYDAGPAGVRASDSPRWLEVVQSVLSSLFPHLCLDSRTTPLTGCASCKSLWHCRTFCSGGSCLMPWGAWPGSLFKLARGCRCAGADPVAVATSATGRLAGRACPDALDRLAGMCRGWLLCASAASRSPNGSLVSRAPVGKKSWQDELSSTSAVAASV